MNVRDMLVRASDNHFVLPKFGDMKTDVHAFLSEALLDASFVPNDGLWKQAVLCASYEGALGMYLMPDTHMGYTLPVGGVLVTEDTILQAGSGYDISCGVIYLKVPDLPTKKVADLKRRRRWVEEVERRVATGVGTHKPDLMQHYDEAKVEEILRFGAAAIGIDANLCERQYIPIPDDMNVKAIERAYKKAQGQLGSVGAGNHFVEMQVDRDDGSVWIMIHCGSRGFGYQIADHFFHRGAELRGLAKGQREQSWLRRDEPLGQEYWNAHNMAANFAVANRWTIVRGIQEATQEVFHADVEPFYEISHNLVQEETLVLPDGTTKRGFVHRKGSTRAFPAGHPDLVGTRWEQTGHPVLIPGSMYDGAAILYPLAGAYKSGCSVNHGSGRVLGRNDAERKLKHKHDEIDKEMAKVKRTFNGVTIEGIVGNHRRTPLDECRHVYKDLDEVLAVLEAEGIAKIAHRLYPIANLKGAD